MFERVYTHSFDIQSDFLYERYKNMDSQKELDLIIEYEESLLNNLFRFFRTIEAKKPYEIMEYKVEYLSFQNIDDIDQNTCITCALACEGKDIVKLASLIAKKEYQSINSEVLDCFGEFINLANGIFISHMSDKGIELDMEPQRILTNTQIDFTKRAVVFPFIVEDIALDFVVWTGLIKVHN